MPALAPVVLKDFAKTTYSFTPVGKDKGIASFVSGGGVPLADLRMSYGSTKTATGRIKSTLRIAVPRVQTTTVNGVEDTKVLRTGYIDLTVTSDPSSTLAERTDLFAYLDSAINLVDIGRVVFQGEQLYG